MGGSSLCPEVLGLTWPSQPGALKLHVLDNTDPAAVAEVDRAIAGKKALFRRRLEVGRNHRDPVVRAPLLAEDAATRTRATWPRRAPRSSPSPIRPRASGSSPRRRSTARRSSTRPTSAGATRRSRTSAWCRRRCIRAPLAGDAGGGRHLRGRLERRGSGRGEPGRAPRRGARRRLQGGTRQADLRHVARDRLARLLDRAAGRRVDRQGRQGDRPHRRRAAGRARGLRQRSAVRLPALRRAGDAKQDAAVAALEAAGHPVVRIAVESREALGREFFRWEMATAIAGRDAGREPLRRAERHRGEAGHGRAPDHLRHRGEAAGRRGRSDLRGDRPRSHRGAHRLGGTGRLPGVLRLLRAHAGARRRPDPPARRLPRSLEERDHGRATARASCTRPASCTRAARTRGSSSS